MTAYNSVFSYNNHAYYNGDNKAVAEVFAGARRWPRRSMPFYEDEDRHTLARESERRSALKAAVSKAVSQTPAGVVETERYNYELLLMLSAII